MSDARINLRIDGPVAWLTIRREEKLNALDAGMVDALFPPAAGLNAPPHGW